MNFRLNIIQGDDSDDDEKTEIRVEGYLYKITTSKKLKKLWFKLIDKDLYYFKNKEDKNHKGMHNLSGVFVQEDEPMTYDNQKFLSFSVVYPKKSRHYYVENKEEYDVWVRNMRKATGYSNLTDIYEVKVTKLP